MNFPYFTLPKFPLLVAFINIFLLSFWSHKTCYKSFAIPIAYTGYDGCPSHYRFPQAKLIFPLDLSKKINPFSCHNPPGIPTFFSYSFPTFFFYSFPTFFLLFLSHFFLLFLFQHFHRYFFFFIFSSPRNF
jgi:hypothetical protein